MARNAISDEKQLRALLPTGYKSLVFAVFFFVLATLPTFPGEKGGASDEAAGKSGRGRDGRNTLNRRSDQLSTPAI
jgi:hypothetical protein